MRAATFLVAAMGAVLGCGQESDRSLPTGAAARALPLDDGLLWVGERALALDLAGEPRAAWMELPAGELVAHARVRGGASEAVLLTSGRDQTDRAPAIASHALVVQRGAVHREFTLKGRYRALAVAEDGRFAIAHQPAGSVVLQNAIEVIDLDQPADAPTATAVVNLQLDGRAPSRFVFSPSPGFDRRMVVIPFAGALVLVDLEHPERAEVSIPLGAPGDPRAPEPQRILFQGSRIFVQSSGASQVLTVELIDDPDASRGFRVLPSLLTGSAPIADIALSGSGEQLGVLALGLQLQRFDPRRGTSTTIATASFARVLPFEGGSPSDPTEAPRALLYTPGQSKLGFADVGGGDTFADLTLEQVELGAPASTVEPLATRKLAVAVASQQISVIDLQQRRVDPYRLDAPLRAYLIDESVPPRVWVLTQTDQLAVIDVEGRRATVLPIPLAPFSDTPEGDPLGASPRLIAIPGARPRIAVDHGLAAGRLTLIDAIAPARESAVELVGFFLAGLFD